MSEKSSIKQKLAKLDELVEWFESDDIEIEQAIEKFDQAEKLAREIEKELQTAKNKIEVIKKKFDA